jgi:hypothetical protein
MHREMARTEEPEGSADAGVGALEDGLDAGAIEGPRRGGGARHGERHEGHGRSTRRSAHAKAIRRSKGKAGGCAQGRSDDGRQGCRRQDAVEPGLAPGPGLKRPSSGTEPDERAATGWPAGGAPSRARAPRVLRGRGRRALQTTARYGRHIGCQPRRWARHQQPAACMRRENGPRCATPSFQGPCGARPLQGCRCAGGPACA